MPTKKQNITAIVFDKRGRPISVGKNSYVKTHPLQARLAHQVGTPDRIFLHAEVDALVKLQDWSRAHAIGVFRYAADGRPMNAKPCAVCQKLIERAGIQKVFYTQTNDNS